RAIATVLRDSGQSLSPKEIFEAISERNLYTFRAQDPLHVVTGQLRRHCRELNFPSAREVKYFSMTVDGRFQLLTPPERVPKTLYEVSTSADGRETTRLVSIPSDDQDVGQETQPGPDSPSHSEIQWRLLDLGSQMGMSVWAPIADRGKSWNGKRLAD